MRNGKDAERPQIVTTQSVVTREPWPPVVLLCEIQQSDRGPRFWRGELAP